VIPGIRCDSRYTLCFPVYEGRGKYRAIIPVFYADNTSWYREALLKESFKC
jgi:hypothetical protein